MAHLGATFDASTVDPATGFELFPVGKYVVQIVSSEMRPTKDGGGQYLWLELDVLEGPLQGRKLFDRLNLVNASAQTVEIANRQMAAIREATGVANPQDSQELHYKPHVIRVEFIPAGTVQKNGYTTTKDGNEVKGWKRAEGVVQAAPAAQPTPAAGSAPWRRSA